MREGEEEVFEGGIKVREGREGENGRHFSCCCEVVVVVVVLFVVLFFIVL